MCGVKAFSKECAHSRCQHSLPAHRPAADVQARHACPRTHNQVDSSGCGIRSQSNIFIVPNMRQSNDAVCACRLGASHAARQDVAVIPKHYVVACGRVGSDK